MIDKRNLDLINLSRKNDTSINWSEIKPYEELYSKFNFVVFDLPLIKIDDMDKFNNIWNREYIESYRLKTDISSEQIDPYPRFKALDTYNIDPNYKDKVVWAAKYVNLLNEFPLFHQQIFDLLPFDKVSCVRLWQSMRQIHFHRDTGTSYLNMPTEIRIMIYDENDSGTLIIKPELCIKDTKIINLPETSNTFAWNNVRCLHSSVKHKDKDKLLAIILGKINVNKLVKLIQHGYDRYPQYASLSNDNYSSYLEL